MSELRMSDFYQNLPWRTDGNVSFLYVTPEQNRAIAIAVNSHDQLVDTITEQEKVISELAGVLESFERVTDIWLPNEVADEHIVEAEALHMIRHRYLKLLAKHKQSKGEHNES